MQFSLFRPPGRGSPGLSHQFTSGFYRVRIFLIMIVGLTGSFGSGKSTVAEMLKELVNARVVDADVIARNLQRKGEPGYSAIVENFGPDALGADGELDRRKIAAWVFADKRMLDKLNSLIHPLVWDEEVKLLREHGNENLRVLMVPLLYETGADRLCDKVIVVAVDDSTREQRLQVRDNLSPEQVQKRLASQMPQEEKIRRADYVIHNNGSLAETRQQVLQVLKQLGTHAET